MAAISISDFVRITFESAQDSNITAAESGVVCLLLQDTATYKGTYYIKSTKQIPEGISAANVDSIKLALMAKPAQVIAVIQEGSAEAVTIASAKALVDLEGLKFNYLAVPGVDSKNGKVVADWAKAHNDANPMHRFCVVLPEQAADSQFVINFGQAKMTIDGKEYTGSQATAYVAAAIAATVPTLSMTYKESVAESCSPMTLAEIDAAGAAGKMVMVNDDRVIRFANDANSLTTVGPKQDDAYQDIRCVEIMNLFFNSVKTGIYHKYIGKYTNNYANKLLLVGEIFKLLKRFEAKGLVEQGDSDVQIDLAAQTAYLQDIGYTTKDGRGVEEMDIDEIKRANTKKHVFIKVRLKPLNAIEAVDIVVRT